MNNNALGYAEDRILTERILRGETQAFSIIIKNTEHLVAQIIFKMIPVSEDRKDLAQDVYLKVFHHLSGFKFQSKLSTWIAQITYNTCLSWMQKKKFSLPGNMEDEGIHSHTASSYNKTYVSSESERQLFEKELKGILQREIDILPPVYQTLITLFHQESMNYEELVQVTSLPIGTVKSHLFRARKMLRENLLSKYQKHSI